MPTCERPIAVDRTPKALPLEFAVGDAFPFTIKVNRDLHGHTLHADVVDAETGLTECSFATAVEYFSVEVAGFAETHTKLSLLLTGSQTAQLGLPGSYRWALWWVDPAGRPSTILHGRIRAMRARQ